MKAEKTKQQTAAAIKAQRDEAGQRVAQIDAREEEITRRELPAAENGGDVDRAQALSREKEDLKTEARVLRKKLSALHAELKEAQAREAVGSAKTHHRAIADSLQRVDTAKVELASAEAELLRHVQTLQRARRDAQASGIDASPLALDAETAQRVVDAMYPRNDLTTAVDRSRLLRDLTAGATKRKPAQKGAAA